MYGKAVIRILFVLALMVTAHLIKPFSFGKLTTHMLGTARSFSFVLPEAVVASLEHANYLAVALGVGSETGLMPIEAAWTNDLVARVETASAKIYEGTGKAGRKVKSALKRSSNIKRSALREKPNVAASLEQEIAFLTESPEMPEPLTTDEALELLQPVSTLISLQVNEDGETEAIPTQLLFLRKSSDCNKDGDSRLVKLVAVVTEKIKPTDCKGEATSVEAEEETIAPTKVEVATPPIPIPESEFDGINAFSKSPEKCPLRP